MTKIGMYEARLGLSGRLKLLTHFSTFKQPKGRVEMAAQSCKCSTDANAEKGPNL